MKLIVLACLATCAFADVSHVVGKDESKANIKAQELDVSPEGGYRWSFESDNGISARAQGEVHTLDPEITEQVVQGDASWLAPDGQQVSFQYVADKNGYQPQGSHLPTPPPIPEFILRALQYIRDHPPPPEKN